VKTDVLLLGIYMLQLKIFSSQASKMPFPFEQACTEKNVMVIDVQGSEYDALLLRFTPHAFN